jgi:hypothetical protein
MPKQIVVDHTEHQFTFSVQEMRDLLTIAETYKSYQDGHHWAVALVIKLRAYAHRDQSA